MNNLTKYSTLCPVCGYDGFQSIPEYDDICPCCFFAFYVNDKDWTYEELRNAWISDGALWAWGRNGRPKPMNWSPIAQFQNLPYVISEKDKIAMGHNPNAAIASFKLNSGSVSKVVNYGSNYLFDNIIALSTQININYLPLLTSS